MKILLINLKEPTTGKRTVTPPIGLWGLRAGSYADVDICDEQIGDRVERALKGKYDIIGISARFSIQHDEYKRVAALAGRTRAMVMAGGFHAAAVPSPPGVDYICPGAGEPCMAEIIGKDMPEYHYPEFTLSEIKRYWSIGCPHDLQHMTNRWIPVETSRGCPRRCAFCGVWRYWGRRHSLPFLEEYFGYLMARGIQEIFVEDDNLTADQEEFERFLELIKRFEFYWSTPNGIQVRNLLQIADRLPPYCWRVSIAFETGSPRTAKLMNLGSKWTNYNEASLLVHKLREVGIKSCGFFIIGYPGETMEDVRRTLEFANCLPLDDRHIYIATPYPGTDLYDRCKENGWLVKDGEDLYRELRYTRGLIRTEYLDPDELVRIREEDRERALETRSYGS